jgi:hypothetical protein
MFQKLKPSVRFQVLTAASMKFRVFLDETPCSHVEVDRRFRGAYCLHHKGDETVRTSELSANLNVNPRRYIPEDSKLQVSLEYEIRILLSSPTAVAIVGL